MKWLTSILILLTGAATAQDSLYEEPDADRFRVAFWNLENLFDTVDDSLTRDDEFTEEGMRHWTGYRYYQKLQNMAKTLVALGGWEPADIVGLCEVENKMVVRDLIERTPLKTSGYEIVHYQSPDSRGIDVALLYNPETFTVLHSEPILVDFLEEGSRPTRDILYVKGITNESDTLHVFINHWPSRYGGHLATNPKRMRAATILRGVVDSLKAVNPCSNLIVTGDFNDEPEDESLQNGLRAHDKDAAAHGEFLVNLMIEKEGKEGTHKYQGAWGILDHMIVSTPLLQGGCGLQVVDQQANIFRRDWLLEEDPKYPGSRLNRTFIGMQYHGGFSDHFPVYIDLAPLRIVLEGN